MLICAGLGEERLLTRTPGWKKGKEVCLLPAGIKRPKILRFAPEHSISRRAKALLAKRYVPLDPGIYKDLRRCRCLGASGIFGLPSQPICRRLEKCLDALIELGLFKLADSWLPHHHLASPADLSDLS